MDRTSHFEAEMILTSLAEEFRLAVPELVWSNRNRRGKYQRRPHRIITGPRAWRGTVSSLLHEFAHALAWRRSPGCRSHGKEFKEALHDTVAFWYGDATKYPWDTEYRSVYAYGHRQGFTSKRHFRDHTATEASHVGRLQPV
jgi:hypothetical protein